MDGYNNHKQTLLEVNRDLVSLLSAGVSLPGMPKNAFNQWTDACETLLRQIEDETMRVAVVGAIKSGKSTFLNSLLGGDYLKRGAGVVTSIVTRIRKGRRPTARMVFKSWEEINEELSEALALLPTGDAIAEKEKFDLRNTGQRSALQQLLGALPVEHLINSGTRNLNTVLLQCFLAGFDRVESWIGDQHAEKTYQNGAFREHWRFVGDDALAVYLKDLQLEIDSPHLESDTEFADCQGSDSPNPLHLAMIQDYLQLAHLIVYVISSRTGLREADIKFLSMIRKMGLIENVVYVVNVDISEHESLEDLKRVTGRIEEELALIAPEPKVYSFSALCNLFGTLENSLPEKDRLRLEQWLRQVEISTFLRSAFGGFLDDLNQQLNRKRFRLILRSQIERHGVVLEGMGDWISINREVLLRNEQEAGEIIDAMRRQQGRMDQIKTVIETTSQGAVPKIKNELNTDINRFFDASSGDCVGKIIHFVRNHGIDLEKYRDSLDSGGFLNTLYMVFQEFKQALDTTMTNTFYPEVVRFVREEEKKLEAHFRSIFEPYEGIVEQGRVELGGLFREFSISDVLVSHHRSLQLPDLEAVKTAAGLKLPPMVAFLRYSAKIKTEAFVNLGFFAVVRAFRKLLKKDTSAGNDAQLKALQRSIKRMKRVTEESLIFQCKDYRENLKFKYFYRLVEEVSRKLAETLVDRFQTFSTETAEMMAQVSRRRSDRERAIAIVTEMESLAKAAGDKIERLRTLVQDSAAP